jgi:hypothetical protein
MKEILDRAPQRLVLALPEKMLETLDVGENNIDIGHLTASGRVDSEAITSSARSGTSLSYEVALAIFECDHQLDAIGHMTLAGARQVAVLRASTGSAGSSASSITSAGGKHAGTPATGR